METLRTIEGIESRLREWAGAALHAEVSFRMPDKTEPANSEINFYLVDLLKTPRARVGSKRPPLQITLRYLATAFSPDPVEARRLASELLMEAIDQVDFDVEPDPVPIPLWLALGVPPRPAFLFRVPLIREREEQEAPFVRKMVVRSTAIVGLSGLLIGPDETPIMGAVVELPALNISARTGTDGGFAFATVPAEPRELVLRIKARGREMSVRTAEHHDSRKPMVIHFNLLEA